MTSSRGAADELVARVLGAATDSVEVRIAPPTGVSRFAVEASAGRVLVDATDGVAAASGLRHYLIRACGLDPVDLHPAASAASALPQRWPDLDRLETTSPWRWRYHMNYCTFGYSAAFWDWARWEREIDLMAMSGVNLPLATVGFEGAWLRALQDFGLSADRALGYLGSPAYLPWVWMGCVHDHGSPMTPAEVDARVRLGRQILQRQRELGMTPVLPGFAGYLPQELAGAGGRPVDWMGFTNHAVDPGERLYEEFGSALLAAQEDMFGSDGFYSVDPFVEGTPPVEDPADVAAYAEAVAAVLERHYPGSTWVLQGWPFDYRADYWDARRTAAFLEAMPVERTLVLDLWAEHTPVHERTAGFAGRPWCWSVLHSLGGRPGLHGAIDVIAREPDRLRGRPGGEMLVGVGTTMESLGHDPVVYALLADVRWAGAVPDLEGWLDAWVTRRYGGCSAAVRSAWRAVVDLCYRDGAAAGPPTSVVASRPSLGAGLRPRLPLNLTTPERSSADAAVLAKPWEILAEAWLAHPNAALHRDVVEVGLDALARSAAVLLDEAVDAADAAGTDASARLAEVRRGFVATVSAMERLADSHPEFRLESWVRDARSRGATPARGDALEQDAKRLLTVWVRPGHQLSDYAGRHWSGLLAGYYLPRWEAWFEALAAGSGGRDPAAFDDALTRFELDWLGTPLEGAAPARAADGGDLEEAREAVLAAQSLLRSCD